MVNKESKTFLLIVGAVVIIALILAWALRVDAWTTTEFRVGHSTVSFIDDEGNPVSYKKWTVTSHPEYMGYSEIYKQLYSHNIILQVMLIRRAGKEDEVALSHRIPETDPQVQAGLAICRRVMSLIKSEVKEAEILIVTYHVQLQQINMSLQNSQARDRKLHEKIVRVLNRKRERLMEAGDFTVDGNIAAFYKLHKENM